MPSSEVLFVLLQKEVCKVLGYAAFREDTWASGALCEKHVQTYLGKTCAADCWPVVGKESYTAMVEKVRSLSQPVRHLLLAYSQPALPGMLRHSMSAHLLRRR